MLPILHRVILGNTISDYLLSLAVLLAGIVLANVGKRKLLVRLKAWAETTSTGLDDAAVRIAKKFLVPAAYLAFTYLAFAQLVLAPGLTRAVDAIAMTGATVLLVGALVSVVNHGLQRVVRDRGDAPARHRQLRGIRGLIDLLIWLVALLFLLDNLGVQVSAAIAGLGIGGIAVALAAQAVLGDLFSYFVIFFDKPFEVGDFIVVGDKMGSVEKIGIKTTRLRALGGEQLVFSNTDLTSSRLQNFQRLQSRRVVLTVGVVYDTPVDKLRIIPRMVRAIVEALDGARFDRGHLAGLGESSLDFEFAYYVDSADYNTYMTLQQEVNLGLLRAFERAGICFAFPTQTLQLTRPDRAGSALQSGNARRSR